MDREQALEIVREYYPSSGKDLNEALETLIPELKESEDERIRQDIITTLSIGVSCEESALHPGAHTTLKEAISWLEKQGEKNKHTKHPDMVANLKEYLANTPKEQLEKDWDELKHWNNVGPTVEEFLYGKQSPAWSEEDEKMLNKCIEYASNIVPVKASKESGLFVDFKRIPDEKAQDWLKSLKSRVQPQLKSEWSDEDYNEIETIACHLDNIDNQGMAEMLRNIRDKYYHIIPQNTWKPSDEQMEYLTKAITTLGNEGYNKTSAILYELRTDLNKLKG